MHEVLAYPLKSGGFSPEACSHALDRAGLDHLIPLLEAERRWERDLSQDEQLRLAFARIILRAPPWVVIDEALAALEVEALDRVVDVLGKELAGTAVIHIGRAAESRDPLFTRVLHLVKAPGAAPRGRGELPDEVPLDGGGSGP